MRACLSIGILTVLLVAGCTSGDGSGSGSSSAQKVEATGPVREAVPSRELAGWRFLGTGTVEYDAGEDAVMFGEGEGSVGVTLVSPKSYGTSITVSFKVRPSSFESVNVVIISASDKATGGDIVVPDGYDGNFGFWTEGDVQNYLFAFHNAAHERKPFILRSPGGTLLAEAPENVMGEDWYDIELGRDGTRLWLKVDGRTIVEGTDPDMKGLPGGKLGFRLRGTPDARASALIKDVVITEKR